MSVKYDIIIIQQKIGKGTDIMDYAKIINEREMVISKSNKMIREARSNLTAMEQKIVYYLFSKIKPDDNELTEYTFEIKSFCQVCGIDYSNGGNYKYVKQVIKGLSDKSFWVMSEDGTETLCRWIQKARLNKGTGKGVMKLDEDIQKYALGLVKEGNFTQFLMIYTLPMKSQYSRDLYELLKSREFEINKYHKEYVSYDVAYLKKRLNADKDENGKELYKDYYDFERRVIKYAVDEINNYSDIWVNYVPVPMKTGKRGRQPIGSIQFFIKTREISDQLFTRVANHMQVDEGANIKTDRSYLVKDI